MSPPKRDSAPAVAAAQGAKSKGNAVLKNVAPAAERRNGGAAMVALIEAAKPAIVSKQYVQDANGALVRKTDTEGKPLGGRISRGRVQVRQVPTLQAFAELLQGLTPRHALAYGVPHGDDLELTTEAAWVAAGRPKHQTARIAGAWNWPQSAAVMMFDYDPRKDGSPPLPAEAVVAAVRAVPGFEDVDLLWWPSGSSCIYDDVLDTELRGIAGQRVYALVREGADIDRTTKAVREHLWAKGHGYFEVSKSGALLERTVFDLSVWQPTRLDFAGGAGLGAGLVQRRGAPVLHEGTHRMVDTRARVKVPAGHVARAAANAKEDARAAQRDKAAEARAEFRRAMSEELRPAMAEQVRRAGHGANIDGLVDQAVERALRGELVAEWPLEVRDPQDGSQHVVRVRDVLADTMRWHGAITRDPLEPGYDGGRWVGKLYLLGARQRLHSMAHGGTTYRISRATHSVEFVGGHTAQATNGLLEILREQRDLFDMGSALVQSVGGGRLVPLSQWTLGYWVGAVVQYWRAGKNGEQVDIDPPPTMLKQVLELGQRRELRPLVAIVNAPTLRPDGTVLDTLGYDEETGLLLDTDDVLVPVPDAPTPEQLVAALAELWEPIAGFPYAGDDDRAVALAAMLTAVVSAALPNCPAFAFDAPAQGTGKTLLARTVGALCAGRHVAAWPPVDRRDDSETRKRITTAVVNGDRFLLWDNIVGQFDSPSVAALLTSPIWADRILGVSAKVHTEPRMLVAFTGNNLAFTGDVPRRVLKCRIDSGAEAPHMRKFSFDPPSLVLARRQNFVSAALTLLRGYVVAGRPVLSDKPLGSFEDWDRLVRQAVLWIARDVAPWMQPNGLGLGDPANTITSNMVADDGVQTLHALLASLSDLFGAGAWFAPGEVADCAVHAERYRGFATLPRQATATDAKKRLAVADSLDAMLGREASRGYVTPQRIGRVLQMHRDRVAGGLVLRVVEDKKSKNSRYRVLEVGGV